MTDAPAAGVFVALEGPDGAGKTTQARMLVDRLRDAGVDPLLTREPGGTTLSEQVRKILLDSETLSPRAELLLLLASRSTLVDEVVRPALAAGRVVITDRFHLSTLAYQGYGRALPFDEVEAMNRFATAGLEPDLTILLDIDVEVGEARRAALGDGPDRIERAGGEFHQTVTRAYRLLAEGDQRIVRIDAAGEPAAVHGAVVRVLGERFPETFGPLAGSM